MSAQDYEQLTLFQEGSHASLLVLPGSAEARKMTVTSGRRCSALYKKSGPLGCLVRTCLESSIWHSTRCYLTWRVSATPAKHLLFQLAVSMPRTNDSESLFWPTPTTNAPLCGGTGNFQTLQLMEAKGMITHEERLAFQSGSGKTNPDFIEWLMGYFRMFTGLIPTPTATDYRGGIKKRYYRSQNVQVERERERERLGRPAAEHRMLPPWEDWIPEPDVGRVADGVPDRVDRIKCLGNAVVPQQFYPFFMGIAKVMDEMEEKEK